MALALFIDDNYLRDYTPMGKSIDISEIYPFIDEAQDCYTQDILGTPLYNDLVNKLATGVTFSSVEIELINIFSKALAYWTVYMAIPHLGIKIRNLGVVRPQADNTQVASLSDLKYIREEMSNMAEFWNQRTINFICAKGNTSLFPLYNAASKDMYPNTTAYDSDIYIEERYKGITNEELRFLKKYLS